MAAILSRGDELMPELLQGLESLENSKEVILQV